MEKTIRISGKDVGFKVPASFPVRYRNATGRDFFADLGAMQEVADGDLQVFDSSVLYDIVHAAARIYDETVPADLVEWLDTFQDFPILEVFHKLEPMLMASMKSSKK